jgi:hypothetical protein
MKQSYSSHPTQYRGGKEDTPGRMRHEPHPNGGEVARVDIPRAKMPERQSSAPITHTDLNTDLGKMPKKTGGPAQRDPHRR